MRKPKPASAKTSFIKTGPELSPQDLSAAGWPVGRAPYLLETSRPGIFAVGDVRGGNVKRVASAVGEGSIAVAFAHQVLHLEIKIRLPKKCSLRVKVSL